MSWLTVFVVLVQFSQNNKLIVFVSSCEAVEFLHSLFTSVLSTNHKPRLSFLRLHGNMKQEVRPPSAVSCKSNVSPLFSAQSLSVFVMSEGQWGCVCFLHQDRSEVFQQFSVSQSGILLCTVSISVSQLSVLGLLAFIMWHVQQMLHMCCINVIKNVF